MASNPNTPIHPSFDERISVRVEGQLPQFVKEDHTTFVAFLEAYYEYLEQIGKPYEIIGNLKNYFNIDKTVDDFLQYFKTQFAKDVPEAVFINSNKPHAIKRLRDFYRAKGSEKSFQFLFRLLYQEEIEFYYPSVDMLRVSDGRYTKDKILRCIDTSGSSAIFDFTGKTITGGMEYELGSDSSFLEYTNYTTTTSEVELGGSTIFNKDLNIDWMMITITEAAGTGTPDCKIKFQAYMETFWVWLIGIGDFTIMPMRGMNKDDALIELISTDSTTLAKVDILIGEVS